MKKTLVAVAALAAFGAAQAQSSVKLGGVLDAGVATYSQQAGGKSVTSANGGGLYAPSNFNLSGSEDLGGGLKANFMLESGISAENGAYANTNGGLFGRMAYVGVSGGFGTVNLGLQFDPAFIATLHTDPMGGIEYAAGVSQWLNTVTLVGNTGASTAGIFDSNAVSYSTPKMNGFDATVLYSLGGVSGNSSANSVTSFGAKFDGVKGLLISVGALQTKGATGTTGQNEYSVGASYNMGAFTVAANYLDAKSTGVTPTVERTSTNFGGSYQINSNLKVMAGYYDVEIKNGGSLNTTAAMFDYSLSKTTGIYFGGQNAKNKNFGAGFLDAGGVGNSFSNTTSTGLVAGIHKAF